MYPLGGIQHRRLNRDRKRIMNVDNIPPLRGGIALRRPTNAQITSTIHNLPLQARYYLPLVDYSRNVIQALVAIGDSVLGGELIAPGIVAPTSGTIIERQEHPWPHPSKTLVPTLILQADGNDTSAVQSPIPTNRDSHSEKLNRIEQAAVHGLGGAAFSTARKIRRALESETITLIINAVECEPGICCDDALIQEQAVEVLSACSSLCRWLNISSALFAIEDDKPLAIKALNSAMAKYAHSIKLIVLPAKYPSGAEAPLVQRLTGTTPTKSQRAADQGVLCLNVATVLSIHRALSGHAAKDRIVSITTRDLKHSINIRALFGSPISAILNYAEVHSPAIKNELDKHSSTIHIGGPVSGFEATLNESPVLATTNAILVGPTPEPVAASACIRCTECSTVCPVNLLPQELYLAAKTKDTALAERYSLDTCLLCGCCDLVCPASIPLTNWFRFAKDSVNQQRTDVNTSDLARQRSDKRIIRLQRLADEKASADAARRTAAAQRNTSTDDIKAALARAKKKRPKS